MNFKARLKEIEERYKYGPWSEKQAPADVLKLVLALRELWEAYDCACDVLGQPQVLECAEKRLAELLGKANY